MLPFGTELAAGTLRVLARRQGTGRATATGPRRPARSRTRCAARRTSTRRAGSPSRRVYYGTIDATPLWITLLHDAWRWGMPAAEVEALLPNLRAATPVAHRPRRPRRRRPAEVPGRAAAPGWPTRAGRTPATPSAGATAPSRRRRSRWCEAQGYAVEAAEAAAALFEAFGDGGGGRAAHVGGRDARPHPRPVLGRRRRGPAASRSPWTATAAASTASPPTWGTCSAPARWTRTRSPSSRRP